MCLFSREREATAAAARWRGEEGREGERSGAAVKSFDLCAVWTAIDRFCPADAIESERVLRR